MTQDLITRKNKLLLILNLAWYSFVFVLLWCTPPNRWHTALASIGLLLLSCEAVKDYFEDNKNDR